MLAVHLREDGEHVGEARVGDELLGAGEPVDVTDALRARLRGERVAPGARLGERVGGEQLAGRELRQVVRLLRLGSVVDDRQRADAGVRAPRHAERRTERAALGDEHRRRLVEPEPAVPLGDVDHEEPELAGTPEERGHQPLFLGLDLVELRQHLAADEVLGRLRVEQVVVGELGARELRMRSDGGHQPAPT